MKNIFYSSKTTLVLLGIFIFNSTESQTLFIPSGTAGIGTSTSTFIGIGIASPVGGLHLKGNGASNFSQIRLENTATGGVTGYIQTHQGYLGFGESGGGADVMVINAGKIGIGLTGTRIPAAKLDVVGTFKLTNGSQGVGKILTSDANGLATWQTPAVASSQWTTNGSNIYFNTGNVGIGTTSPTAKLDIDGILQVRTGGYLKLGAYNSTTDNFGYVSSAGQANGIGLKFETTNGSASQAGLTRMTILNDGNVGIGTISPSTKLEVTGRIRANGDQFRSSITSGDWVFGGFLATSGVVSSNGDFAIYGQQTPATRLVIKETTGNVGIGLPAPAYKLDVCGTIRAKEVRVNLTGCDFVFENKYKLMPLRDLEEYITQHKHLPEIAPAKEMETADGVQIGEMQSKLLQKVEELTLYMIAQNKKIEELQKQLDDRTKK